MSKQQQTPPAANPKLSEQALEFLSKECDRLLALYTQEQNNAQNVFNFYLTFATTVVGAVIVLLQTGPSSRALITALLFFAVSVGSVYMSALSGRYARSLRYSFLVDEIRRFLVQKLDMPLPAIYNELEKQHNPPKAKYDWVYWLAPSGTYQMFMVLVNSSGFAAMTFLVFNLGGADFGRAVFASMLVFILTATISNIYSRLVIRRFGKGITINVWSDSPAWAARE